MVLTSESFDAALASQGLSEKDLKVINLDFNAAVAALAAKQIDASWGSSGLTALQAKGLAELPLNTKDLGGAGSVQSAVRIGRPAFDADDEATGGEVALNLAQNLDRAGGGDFAGDPQILRQNGFGVAACPAVLRGRSGGRVGGFAEHEAVLEWAGRTRTPEGPVAG